MDRTSSGPMASLGRLTVPPLIDRPLLPVIKLVESSPANTPAPAAVTVPPVATSKLVKSIKLVPAVVPFKTVSNPVPTLMAFSVAPLEVMFPMEMAFKVSASVDEEVRSICKAELVSDASASSPWVKLSEMASTPEVTVAPVEDRTKMSAVPAEVDEMVRFSPDPKARSTSVPNVQAAVMDSETAFLVMPELS